VGQTPLDSLVSAAQAFMSDALETPTRKRRRVEKSATAPSVVTSAGPSTAAAPGPSALADGEEQDAPGTALGRQMTALDVLADQAAVFRIQGATQKASASALTPSNHSTAPEDAESSQPATQATQTSTVLALSPPSSSHPPPHPPQSSTIASSSSSTSLGKAPEGSSEGKPPTKRSPPVGYKSNVRPIEPIVLSTSTSTPRRSSQQLQQQQQIRAVPQRGDVEMKDVTGVR